MKSIVFGGVKFIFLVRGEKLPQAKIGNDYGGSYLIWPRKNGLWDIRWKWPDWQEITTQQFDDEHAAFQFAHEHHLKRMKKLGG